LESARPIAIFGTRVAPPTQREAADVRTRTLIAHAIIWQADWFRHAAVICYNRLARESLREQGECRDATEAQEEDQIA